jgi:nitroreductase
MKETRIPSFLTLVEGRKSIRHFSPQPVEREKLNLCLEAARLAPSAENAQPWRFLVVDDPQVKERFAAEAFSGIYKVSAFAGSAPALVLILARLNLVTHRLGRQVQDIHFHYIDIGIAGEHIVLQAEELGIGSCWMGWFSVRKTRKFFKIPAKYRIMAMLAMGYYEKKPSRERKRKSLEEIVFYNTLGDG